MAPTFRDLLSEVKKEIREVSHEHVHRLLGSGSKVKLVDVREADEYAGGRLPGAVHIPRGYLELRIEEKADRDEELVLYCAGGTRSALAARTLREMGYTRVSSLAGGYNRWSDAALPVEKPVVLSAEQKERYRRHLILPEVGEEGQAKLLKSKVLLLGAGGLGSPAALYLAAAGVGTLGVVDADVVDLSNLQRQVLHTLERRGQPKVQSAKAALEALNPDVKVVPFQERLTTANVERILADFDLVLDGGDNFPTRYLLNDACVLMGKPNIHGSVFRFEGQVTTFLPGQGPCYRCLYPSPPPPELAPSCAEAGVLGVLPGLIGMLQATEALKLLLGVGESLVGRLVTFDALGTRFQELKLRRDPECPVCAPGAKVELIDYEQFCATGG
ncbi:MULTISPECIES: molybdopterin-synthase adenylyltransferase MoeB [unclassified Corallococcus]|uniref:molybdopterin-synthase adenylyltransferase MoeB n=1 Tax=unclassified Corallococcus TaxID=2685029 RepID=UPI001A8BFA48|nr:MULTISPECIES: molybdopterin-synthase adenylyltransferase MoeB [unclassified Corallococcus]MBN9683234.1 molybdopterin-synthase adenylyltransferase MoeB [Corallococcus sp. NCSPR001]WAS85241.1 molybdopterin-synthase adenylyltransferase MoeB [Corallococcus sp. NCRR]